MKDRGEQGSRQATTSTSLWARSDGRKRRKKSDRKTPYERYRGSQGDKLPSEKRAAKLSATNPSRTIRLAFQGPRDEARKKTCSNHKKCMKPPPRGVPLAVVGVNVSNKGVRGRPPGGGGLGKKKTPKKNPSCGELEKGQRRWGKEDTLNSDTRRYPSPRYHLIHRDSIIFEECNHSALGKRRKIFIWSLRPSANWGRPVVQNDLRIRVTHNTSIRL